jgi:DNA-binding NarL/FixJ family response regulator
MTSDMIRELLDDHPDVEIVGESEDANLTDAVRRTRPTIVIMAADDTILPAEASVLLDERALRVLAITRRAGTGVLAELVPRQAELGELSGDTLLRVLEGSAV